MAITISNKTAYILIIVGVLVISAGVAIAYGTNNASVMGHSFSELDWNSCETIIVDGISGGAVAQCPAGKRLVRGGGMCETPIAGCGIGACVNLGFLHMSSPNVNLAEAWHADCYKAGGGSDVGARAIAVCCA